MPPKPITKYTDFVWWVNEQQRLIVRFGVKGSDEFQALSLGVVLKWASKKETKGRAWHVTVMPEDVWVKGQVSVSSALADNLGVVYQVTESLCVLPSSQHGYPSIVS